MAKPLRTAVLLAVLFSSTRLACAQDPGTYVGGSFTIATWGVASTTNQGASLTFKNESGATITTGVAGEVGRFVLPHVAVGIEVGQAFRRRLTQRYGYFSPYIRVSGYRDLSLFGVARYEVVSGRVRAALVGGAGPVQGSSLEQVARPIGQSGFTPVFGPFGPENEVTYWTVGATGGVDVAIGVAPHLSVVSQLRVLGIRRGRLGFGTSFADFGLNTTDFRAGLGLRAVF